MPKRPADDLEEGELDELAPLVLENSEDNNEELMQYAILPVAKMEGEVPMTGEEYLYLVRKERNRLPRIATADTFESTSKSLEDLVPSEELKNESSTSLKPDEQWQHQVISVFRNDRTIWSDQLEALEEEGKEGLINIPAINDEYAWNKYLYGSHAQIEPSFEIFSNLGHLPKMRLILYHHRWLESTDTISSGQYKWIYCLLVNTPEGISADDMSIIRALTRSCIKTRNLQSGEVDWDVVANLNAIITIVGLYFRQTDLLQ